MSDCPADRVRIRLLGRVRIESGGAEVPLPTRHARRLLVLLVSGGQLERIRLAEALWPGSSPESSRQNLRKCLQHVRKALGSEAWRLVGRNGLVSLEKQGLWVDAFEFERLLAQGRTAEAVTLYEGVLGGPDAPDLAEEELDLVWNGFWAVRLDEAFERALLELASAAPRHEAKALFERAVARSRADEGVYRQYMERLWSEGDSAGALDVYRRLLAVLEARKAAPSRQIVDLARTIRRSFPRHASNERSHSVAFRGSVDLDRAARLAQELVGRCREVSKLLALVRASRWVTCYGLGGIGKTSLALKVASIEKEDRASGAVLIDLSHVDSGYVSAAARAALGSGLRALDGLDTLIVLDNCEHVLAEARALVHDVLARSPRLTVLATSRVPLGDGLETLFLLRPLADQAVERMLAKRLAPMAMGRERLASLARACAGIPLVAQLAAGRELGGVRAASADAALEGVVLDALGRAARLDREAMACWGVFTSHFTAEDASFVADVPPREARAALARLSQCSLVVPVDGGYRLLPPVRDVIVRQGIPVAAQERFADHVLALARTMDQELNGPAQSEWSSRMSPRLPDFRAVFRWLCQNRPADSLRLACHLAMGFARSGLSEEGLTWFEECWFALGTVSAQESARCLIMKGNLAKELGLAPSALEAYAAAHEAYGALQDPRGVGACCVNTLLVLTDLGRYEEAESAGGAAEQTVSILRRTRGEEAAAFLALNLAKARAALAVFSRRAGLARDLGAQALSMARACGDWHSEVVVLTNLADAELMDGQPEAAWVWIEEILKAQERCGPVDLALAQTTAGLAQLQIGAPETARRFLAPALRTLLAAGHRLGLCSAWGAAAGWLALTGRDIEAVRAYSLYQDAVRASSFSMSPANEAVLKPVMDQAGERIGPVLRERAALLSRGETVPEAARRLLRDPAFTDR